MSGRTSAGSAEELKGGEEAFPVAAASTSAPPPPPAPASPPPPSPPFLPSPSPSSRASTNPLLPRKACRKRKTQSEAVRGAQRQPAMLSTATPLPPGRIRSPSAVFPSPSPPLCPPLCLRISLSTCYLSFGGLHLRASAMSGPARAQINLSRGPITEDLAAAAAPAASAPQHSRGTQREAEEEEEQRPIEEEEEEEEQRGGEVRREGEEDEEEQRLPLGEGEEAARRPREAPTAPSGAGAMTRRRSSARTAPAAASAAPPPPPPLFPSSSFPRPSPARLPPSSPSLEGPSPPVAASLAGTRATRPSSRVGPSTSKAPSPFSSSPFSLSPLSFPAVKLEPATERGSLPVHSTPPDPPARQQPQQQPLLPHQHSPPSASLPLRLAPRTTSMSSSSPSLSPSPSSTSASASASPSSPPSRVLLPDCPVYHPTVSEWSDPVRYIRSISAEAAAWGMCRLVPPAGWSPPFALDSSKFRFTTRTQNIRALQSGAAFVQGTKEYTLQHFQLLAETFKQQHFSTTHHNSQQPHSISRTNSSNSSAHTDAMDALPLLPASPPSSALPPSSSSSPSSAANIDASEVEDEYWRLVMGEAVGDSPSTSSVHRQGQGQQAVQVEYGADLDSTMHGSGFESLQLRGHRLLNASSLYAQSIGWNLRALPLLSGSLLGLLHEHVPGVSTPWLYVGMLFATFCWHVEDSYLFSMNYLHCGACKTWYAAPGSQALRLQQAMRLHYPDLFAQQPDAHHALTLQMSPHVLAERYAVDVCHTVQSAGEFVCTFPAAYHCGFSHGFNVGEAVNFATAPWLPFGREAQEIDRQHARPQCFSLQQLILTMTANTIAALEGDGLGHQTKSLDDSTAPLSLSDAAVLLSELELLVSAEQSERTVCVTAGVARFVPLSASSSLSPSPFSLSSAAAAVPQCSICAVFCFLSYAACERCRLSPVCLRHIEFACSCHGREALRVTYRYSVAQLTRLQQQLRDIVHNAKGSAADSIQGNGASGDGHCSLPLLSRPFGHATHLPHGRSHSRGHRHHRSHSHHLHHRRHRDHRDGHSSSSDRKRKRDHSNSHAEEAALVDSD